MSESSSRAFDNIWLANPYPKSVGKFKLIDRGLGWQDKQDTSQKFTINASEIKSMSWSRCAKDYSLKLFLNDGKTHRFDGFAQEAFKDLSTFVSQYYNIRITQKETSVRGWNWGNIDVSPTVVSFNIGGKPAFEIPASEIANISNQNKEISIDIKEKNQISLPPPGSKPGRKPRDDMLVQMQIYVPGMVGEDEDEDVDMDEEEKKNKKADKEGGEDGEIDETEPDDVDGKLTAAADLTARLKRAANLGIVVGEEIAKFEKVMCLLPRGRFDLILYPKYLRMVGTSQDNTIQFKNIKFLALLPRPDLIYHSLVVSLQPPLRQGNTKYPFLVFHFDEIEHSFSLDEKIKEKIGEKLQPSYDGLLHEVFSDMLSSLSECDIMLPDKHYKGPHEANSGIKCSFKAAEAFLYPLPKAFISIPKPTHYIQHDQIERITFSRVGGQTTRTMELKIQLVSGGDLVFGNIPREEHPFLETYCRSKKIMIENELDEVSTATYGLGDDDDDDDVSIASEEDKKMKKGPDDEDDDESEDEDFVADDSGSDVPEEYDAKYKGGESSDDDEEQPSPKKLKTEKSDKSGKSSKK
ncbi:FACT complex subunit [Nowakowskiella sp. JEL0407]|nr:FACT complex subunit [Nowakowskiella sp. JEL0407]